MIGDYISRIADRTLASDLGAWPAVMVTGPRAVGKTTTSRRLAASVLRMDQPEERGIVLDDPDAAISVGPFPLLLDEWQHAPEVLGAVKRAVDTDRRPGRFVITGSSRNDLIAGSWPGTGRFIDIQLWPLTGRERFGDAAAASLFDRWDTPERFAVPVDAPDILGYVQIALAGGFPAAVSADADRRARWMRSYVQAASTRDLGELDSGAGRRRSPERMRRYLQACALHSAGVVADSALAESARLDRRTAAGYHEVLNVLRLISDTPAWRSNRLKRLVSTPKRYLTDAGLTAWLAGVDFDAARHDSDARARIIDTYVAAQLRAEAEASSRPVQLHHLRTHRGEHEIDLIAEIGFKVAAFEVKTGSAPTRKDARHISWLRDQLPPEQFAGGVVFHTGRYRRQIAEDIEAVPISALWG